MPSLDIYNYCNSALQYAQWQMYPPRSFSKCQRRVFRASAGRQAPAASFSARLVSTTQPIMHILLSKASVAEDRVSPHPTLPRAGTLAPGWYDSRAVLLELLYVSTAATASPAKNLNQSIGMLSSWIGRWLRLAKALQLRIIMAGREPLETADSASRQQAR